jgi:hypothetical protein
LKNKTVSKNLNFEEIYFEEHSYPSLINQITNLRHLSTVRQNRYFRKRYLSYFIGRTKNVIQNKEQGQNNVILKNFLVPVLLCLKDRGSERRKSERRKIRTSKVFVRMIRTSKDQNVENLKRIRTLTFWYFLTPYSFFDFRRSDFRRSDPFSFKTDLHYDKTKL